MQNILVVSEVVDELVFLFGTQDGPNLDGLGWVLTVDLYGLGILSRLEGADQGGHGRAHQRGWCAEAQLP
jgi:hypothetical protein